MIEWLGVDADIGRIGLGAEVGRHPALHRDASVPDPVTRLAAAAVAEVGEELVEAAQGGHATTKNRKARENQSWFAGRCHVEGAETAECDPRIPELKGTLMCADRRIRRPTNGSNTWRDSGARL
jgi:hypothetical protein